MSMEAPPSSRSAAHERAAGSAHERERRSGERDGASSEMHMSIDSQSFVNLGQLMGSRHGTAGGSNSNAASAAGGLADDLGTSCLSDDSEGLRDFDQIFHPRAEQGGSTSSAWSGRALYGRGSAADGDDDDDDDDGSLLPALPSRSTTPGSPRGADSTSNSRPSLSFSSAAEPGWADEDFESDSTSEGGGVGGARTGGRGQDFSSGLRIDLTTAATAASDTKVVAFMTPETQRASVDADDVEESSRPTTTTGMAVVQTQLSSEAAAGEATGGVSSNTPRFLRDSWLHVPMAGDDTAAGEAAAHQSDGATAETEATAVDGPGDAARVDPQQQRYYDAAAAAARARRAAAAALADCGECVVRAVDKAGALAASRLQQVALVVREQVDAGAEACARGQQAVVKAVDNVPQAPVRMWLVRIAGSLVIGALLGGGGAYFALPRATSASASTCTAAGSAGAADATSPWWDTGRGAGAGAGAGTGAGTGEPGEGAEHGFGERLNKALFAARAGEAAAQQVLLEEVRNILAATGKSGGISAEQILRQFNARRFKEASKAWAAAEGGGVAGSDPLDPLFFAPPSTPTTPPAANPSTSPPTSSQDQQHPQHQHQHQHQHQPQQPPFIPEGAAPATECAGGASGSAFCSADGAGDIGSHPHAARAKVQPIRHRRPCPGGWVC